MTDRLYKNESALRSYFGNIAKSQGFKVQHIESGTTGCGIPDTYLSCPDVKGWIEFKLLGSILTVPRVLIVPYRAGQYAWLKNFSGAGTDCWLVLGFQEGIVVARNGEIQKDYLGSDLTDRCVPLVEATNIRNTLKGE